MSVKYKLRSGKKINYTEPDSDLSSDDTDFADTEREKLSSQKLTQFFGKEGRKKIQLLENFIENNAPSMKSLLKLNVEPQYMLNLYKYVLEYEVASASERIQILIDFNKELKLLQDSNYSSHMLSSRDVTEFLKESHAPNHIKQIINAEYHRVRDHNEMSHELQSFYNWWFWVRQLPLHKARTPTVIVTDSERYIKRVLGILNDSIFGLDAVKFQITSMLYQRFINPENRTRPIGWVGPPGVGKTTMAYLVARCEGRPLEKPNISAGISDNGEQLEGSANIYIGSSPGYPVQALCRSGVEDCCILFDEVDKISTDSSIIRGMLSLLDPDHNQTFIDKFIGNFPVDFSKVCFMLTANNLNIHPALIDRIEWISIPNYTYNERETIFDKFIFPKVKLELNYNIEILPEAKNYLLTQEQSIRWIEKCVRRIISDKMIQNECHYISHVFPNIKEWTGVKLIALSDVEFFIRNERL